jgi:DNA-binding YbaB/EbfC family protein
MFGDLGNMLSSFGDLRKRAEQMEKELQAAVIEGSSKDDLVTVRMNGKMEVLDVRVKDEIAGKNAREIETHIRDAVSKASAQARKLTQEKLRDVSGGMSIPGLF